MNTYVNTTSAAVTAACAHIEAWSNHDLATAREFLAEDVRVTVTTTQPIMAPVDTVGADKYMEGLVKFVQAVVPGTARVIEATGDDRNALVLMEVKINFGPNAPEMVSPAARLYLLDDEGKIKCEQVIFYAIPA